MTPDIDRVTSLITRDQLKERIEEMGREISADYAGEDITLVGILKGSIPFLSDLMREITVPVQIDFLELSSYDGGLQSTGAVRLVKDMRHNIQGKHVIIVEDIVDTGLTMSYLLENLATRRPASVKVCTLLHKPARAQVEVPLDYVGFEIPDRFVIGYGLDYENRLRNLPFIGVNIGDGPPWPA